MCIFKYNFLYFSMLFSNIVKHLTSILLIFFRTFPFFQEKTELFRVHSKKLNLWFLMPFVICFLFPLFFSSVLLPSQPKHRCYDVKINKDCACIKNCCNKRSRHDCRIKSDLLCQKRKDTPHFPDAGCSPHLSSLLNFKERSGFSDNAAWQILFPPETAIKT